MSGARFARLDGREPLYQSPPPVHDLESTFEFTHDVGDQPIRRYRDQQDDLYQSDQRQHSISDFTREQHMRQMSYESPRHASASEKPLYNRRDTASSNLSSKLSAVSENTSKLLHPVFAKPWQHVKSFDITGSTTTKTFSRARQRRRIFVTGLIQWLLPATFCTLIIVVMWHYSIKDKVTRQERYFYNSLMLGLTLCLGFAVQSGYKKYANLMRWRILASHYWDLKHFELIMESSSQMAILRLLWPRRKTDHRLPGSIRLVCLLYLIVAFGLQVGIALVGLCVSVDPANGFLDVVKGNVSIANLQEISNRRTYEQLSTSFLTFERQSRAAQEYGAISGRFDVLKNPKGDDYRYTRTIYTTDDDPFYWMWFFDECPHGDKSCDGLVITTNRFLSVVSFCDEYEIRSGGKTNSTVVFVYPDGTEGKLNIEQSALSVTTSYLSNKDEVECGPRCTQTLVVNVGNPASEDYPEHEPQMFNCYTTVSQVEGGPNTTAYLMPDLQARIWAGAIGWSGATTREDNFTEISYPNSPWSWDGTPWTNETAAQYLMTFSTGAIAAMDQFGEKVIVTSDNAPRNAQAVNVKWHLAIIALSTVPGIQLLTLVLVTFWAGAAVIPDGTYLSNARLLRPIIEKLGHNGCLLTGEEIADELGEMGRYRVKYGALRSDGEYSDVQDARYHLDLIVEERGLQAAHERGWLFSDNMPQGRYD